MVADVHVLVFILAFALSSSAVDIYYMEGSRYVHLTQTQCDMEPEIDVDDIIRLAEISATSATQYIRPDEVRKILVKLGFPLTESEKQPRQTEETSRSSV